CHRAPPSFPTRRSSDLRIETSPHGENLTGLDLDVRCRTSHTAERLVQEEPGVGQGSAMVTRDRREDQSTRAGDPTRPQHAHLGFDEADQVVVRVGSLYVTALRVNNHAV